MSIALLDCVECASAGSVRRDFCEVCYAEVEEHGAEGEAAALPPAAPAALRFEDVIAELAAITSLARSVDNAEMLAAVCARTGRLIRRLRADFVSDLGLA